MLSKLALPRGTGAKVSMSCLNFQCRLLFEQIETLFWCNKAMSFQIHRCPKWVLEPKKSDFVSPICILLAWTNLALHILAFHYITLTLAFFLLPPTVVFSCSVTSSLMSPINTGILPSNSLVLFFHLLLSFKRSLFALCACSQSFTYSFILSHGLD